MPQTPNSYTPKEQRPSVLVIGHSLGADIECVEWDSPEPNVADYDVVIMDLTTAHMTQLPPPQAYSVQPRLHQVDMSKYWQWPHIRRSVGRLLLSGGRLFVITDPEIVISPHSARVVLHRARSKTLLPFMPFGERVPAGQPMKWVDPRFDFYFREVGQWNFILTGELEYFYTHFDDQVTCQVHPLAKNRADEMIALSVSVWGDRSKMPGVIYLLPPPTKITSAEAIELLIAHLDNLQEAPLQYVEEDQQIEEQVSMPTKAAVIKKPSLPQEPLSQEKPMTGISPTIYSQLREALLDCGPLTSNDQLSAVFAHPLLKPWRSSVPQAPNPAARADAVIAFLIEKRRSDTKENALVLLLRVLSGRLDPADECHPRLARLADELQLALSGGATTTPRSDTTARPTEPSPSSQMPRPATPKAEPLQPSRRPVSDRSAAAGESQEKPREEAEKKDFFISYNRADKRWAEWIAWQLEETGYTTVIQAWDFRPGSNFIIEMQRAAEQARRTIAVLSPDYLQALYTQPEWAAAFAQDPTGEKGVLLPVRVRECELQGLLSQVVYIDLVGLTEQVAKETLLVGVKQGRVKPTAEPGFPGAAERIISEQPGFPGESYLDRGRSSNGQIEVQETDTQMAQRVFISYERNTEPDASLAMYLARFLGDYEKQTFIDQKRKDGMAWVNEMHDQMIQSDFLVVLLSFTSMKSEIILEEIKFANMQWRKAGRPRILPVRLGYVGRLPYQLDEYLRSPQYILWTSEGDTPHVARNILNAIEDNEAFDRYSESPTGMATWPTTISKSTSDGTPIAAPYPDFDPRLILEAPSGVVDLESPFYIERRADVRLKRELYRFGTTTTIRAPRQMGKTSLLVRGVEYARQQGSPVTFFDFQMIDTSYLQDLDTFLHYMALNIAAALKIESEKVETVWQIPLSPKDRLTRFLEDHVLQRATRPIILAIDEADRLFESTFRQEFFSLIRAWFTMRGYNPLWKKLNVVMVISTQPYLLIDDIHQSPFNIGLRIELEDFTPEQVQDLNNRHGAPLNKAELAEMMALLGGHPYLVRQALYTLVDERMTWHELAQTATKESSPFNQHLRQYLWKLRDRPRLIEAIKSILINQSCFDEMDLTRLISAGLVQQDESGLCRCRCQLYDLYFRRFLL